jgi:light-regulated signal transduction histidine kinase (bacteriophytochrome)
MTKDVTKAKKEEENLKNLNQKLIKNTRELELSNQELEQFAYLASHDLQEPLRMITAFLNLLQKKYVSVLDEKGNQYIDFAVDGASRMKNIIMDLLTYSRVGKVEEKAKETELEGVVANVLKLQKNLIHQKNAKINIGKLPKLKIPVSPIHQVFHNLINNSLKYQMEGKRPEISIEANQKNDFWEFTVQDNGIGIPEASKQRVFVLFSRLHSNSQFPGSGMGLAMCKKIIENLGGDIGFHSKEGAGTTFYFTIPKVIE